MSWSTRRKTRLPEAVHASGWSRDPRAIAAGAAASSRGRGSDCSHAVTSTAHGSKAMLRPHRRSFAMKRGPLGCRDMLVLFLLLSLLRLFGCPDFPFDLESEIIAFCRVGWVTGPRHSCLRGY